MTCLLLWFLNLYGSVSIGYIYIQDKIIFLAGIGSCYSLTDLMRKAGKCAIVTGLLCRPFQE